MRNGLFLVLLGMFVGTAHAASTVRASVIQAHPAPSRVAPAPSYLRAAPSVRAGSRSGVRRPSNQRVVNPTFSATFSGTGSAGSLNVGAVPPPAPGRLPLVPLGSNPGSAAGSAAGQVSNGEASRSLEGGYVQGGSVTGSSYIQGGGSNIQGSYIQGGSVPANSYIQGGGSNIQGSYIQGGNGNIQGSYIQGSSITANSSIQGGNSNIHGGYIQGGSVTANSYIQGGNSNIQGGYVQGGSSNIQGGYVQGVSVPANSYIQGGGSNLQGTYIQSGGSNIQGEYIQGGSPLNITPSLSGNLGTLPVGSVPTSVASQPNVGQPMSLLPPMSSQVSNAFPPLGSSGIANSTPASVLQETQGSNPVANGTLAAYQELITGYLPRQVGIPASVAADSLQLFGAWQSGGLRQVEQTSFEIGLVSASTAATSPLGGAAMAYILEQPAQPLSPPPPISTPTYTPPQLSWQLQPYIPYYPNFAPPPGPVTAGQ